MNPLLQAGIGILANNTGNYGQFGPALAKGVGYGLQNVGQYKQQQADNQDRQMTRLLYGQQVNAQIKKAQQEAEEEAAAKDEGRQWLASMNIDVNNPGGFMAVSSTPQPIRSSPLPAGQPLDLSGVVPDFGNNNPLSTMDLTTSPPPQAPQTPPVDSVLDELGYTEGMKKMFYAHAKSNPQKAMEKLDRETTDYIKAQRKGRGEARDVLAKERAIQAEIDKGTPLGKRLLARQEKSGVNLTVQNMLGEPKPVTLPDGSQAFMQFPKGGGAPVLVQGAFPAAGDSEQMAAGYGERMAESEKIIRSVGEKGNPTVATSIAGSVLPGSAGRYVQSKVMTNEQQMHRQAQEDWVRAKLRKESGAVIADEEMEREIATYFPKPGDTQQVIQQKAKARETAIQGMKKAAGPAGQRINAPTGTVRKYNPATGRIE